MPTALRSMLACLMLLIVVGAAPARGEAQTWEGAVTLPGAELGIVVKLDPDAEPPTGSIDIPLQSAYGLALSDISLSDDAMSFVLVIPGAPQATTSFELTPGPDGTASGSMKQHNMTFPVSLRLLTDAEARALKPRRPQTPEPPFPYASRDVNFPGGGEGVTLAGTLTVPEGQGPFPGVILVSGSGPQDRDETLFDHKPFAVLADHLTRGGFAVLRYDDRGFAQSTGDFASATTDDLALDASAALAFLDGQDGVDASRLGVIGHSEGGTIAPMVAAGDDRVAFIVLLAATGVPGDEVLIEQGSALLLAAGADPGKLGAVRAAHRRTLDAAMGEPLDADAFVEAMRALMTAQGAAMGQEVPPAALEAVTPAMGQQFAGVWMRRFLTLDPREALRKVRVPVLVLNGNLDRQVIPEQNVPAIVGALREGGNERVTVHVFPNLNHLFQPAEVGGIEEYAEVEQTMAPEVLTMIEGWMRGVVGE